MEEKSRIELLGGRKFLLALVIVFVSSLAYAAKYMDGGNWVTIAGLVMASFTYGNLGEHKAKS
jgi:hypothetical protein